jgi:Arc/MetJ-type ribon-helix-helix transcriptional regulator
VTIELARDVEAFLQEQVSAGVCTNPSELVNDTIRSLRELQRTPFKITSELESWLLESADKPITPLTKRDFEALRKRVRSRTGSPAS